MTPTHLPVARVADIPEGTARTVDVAGRTVVLVNHGGWFFALGGRCTHAAAPLDQGRVADGCLLACPWHGAVFDVRTGRVRRGPARKPLSTYDVQVEDGTVLVAVPPPRPAEDPQRADTDRSAPCPSP